MTNKEAIKIFSDFLKKYGIVYRDFDRAYIPDEYALYVVEDNWVKELNKEEPNKNLFRHTYSVLKPNVAKVLARELEEKISNIEELEVYFVPGTFSLRKVNELGTSIHAAALMVYNPNSTSYEQISKETYDEIMREMPY